MDKHGRARTEWEDVFRAWIQDPAFVGGDAAHDLAHVERVVETARHLAECEGADPAVVLPAAWLHDCVTVSKHSAERAQASRMAADRAAALLTDAGYPPQAIPAVYHAIHAHSFSAGVEPESLEARVLQDADRLDALGAIGIARTLLLGGSLGGRLYDPADPFARNRAPDDRAFVIDHFFAKLLHLADRMHTPAAREEARRRTAVMQQFLEALESEIAGGALRHRGHGPERPTHGGSGSTRSGSTGSG